MKKKNSLFFFHRLASPKITTPDPLVQAARGQKLWCSANGTQPIFIAITWNSTVLVNTTSIANIKLHREGNYCCVATNKFGSDARFFSVKFGKDLY